MNNTKEDITRMILDYLKKYPSTGDTLEGISKWWLEYERVERSVDEISNALENLNNMGIVTRRDIEGCSPLYRICKSHD